ncbi:MAG: hypothetical protein ACR2OB_10335 [Solirubrobacteraceae bacterium]
MSATVSQPGISTTRSPFSLLRDAQEAEEVLILTYAASLEFFERFALGEARGLQAATTVISDATMVSADPVTVRSAGVRYIDGRAVCLGFTAFHPKLIVIASRDQATVAIGSGNLTLAGWHGNEELWTVLHADRERGPTTIRGVAAFLRALADGRIQLSAECPAVVRRVADLLDDLAAADPGPLLVSTLDQDPILERLPVGPVDELIVYSPYYDAALAALKAVHDRLQPRQLTVYVQPQTSVEGLKLEAWLAGHGGQLRWCSADRFRHGKLLEWTRNGVREALTGSPNLSTPALLRTIPTTPVASEPTGNGAADVVTKLANCELGTISRIEVTLAPAEAAAPGDGAGHLTFSRDPADTPRPGIIVLGATLIDAIEVHLRLAAPLTTPARIQIHDPEQDWTTAAGLAELPAGKSDYRVPAIGLSAAKALRLYGAAGASNEVFIADPWRARSRPYKRVGPESGPPSGLIRDGQLAVLYEVAELMRPMLLKLGALVPKPTAGGQGASGDKEGAETAAPRAGQTLEEYLAACSAVLDEQVVEWALAIPSLPSLGGGSRIDHQKGLLTTDVGDVAADAGDDDEDAEEPNFAEIVRRATAHRRRQWRTFCEKAIGYAAGWPHLMRAYVARLTLNGVAADLWPDETEKGEILKRLVLGLVAAGDVPTYDEQAAVASYAAIALAILRSDVHLLSVNDEATLRYKAAARAGESIVNDLDPMRIDEIVIEIADAFKDIMTGDDVFDIATQVAAPQTGIAAAITLLRSEYDWDALERDGALVLTEPITALLERELLRAAGLVDIAGPVIIRGTTMPGNSEAICIWRKPFLLIARRRAAGMTGRVYSLAPGETPRTLIGGWTAGSIDVKDNMPKAIEDWLPGHPTPPRAAELLDLLDVG